MLPSRPLSLSAEGGRRREEWKRLAFGMLTTARKI